jgi:hypothetical protein
MKKSVQKITSFKTSWLLTAAASGRHSGQAMH